MTALGLGTDVRGTLDAPSCNRECVECTLPWLLRIRRRAAKYSETAGSPSLCWSTVHCKPPLQADSERARVRERSFNYTTRTPCITYAAFLSKPINSIKNNN